MNSKKKEENEVQETGEREVETGEGEMEPGGGEMEVQEAGEATVATEDDLPKQEEIPENNEKQQSPEKCNECPICYQEYTYKTELPDCGHTFCFLCIKGAALRHGACPLCRKRISRSVFRDPVLMSLADQPSSNKAAAADAATVAVTDDETVETKDMDNQKETTDEVHWFYGARHGGWWRYEHRHEDEIEEAYLLGMHSTDMLIAGSLYCIDFDNMCQYRKDVGRMGRFTRAIKRVEKADPNFDSAVRGVAGLRTPTETSANLEHEQQQNVVVEDLATITVRINTVDLKQR